LLSIGSLSRSQNPNPPEIQAQEGPSQEAKPTFRVRAERNLVTVKVVVRDHDDRPVGDLRREEFRVFDDGKPQEILGFTLERSQPAPEAAPPPPAERTAEAPRAPVKAPAQRFVILYFDDYHMEPEGIARTRNAAWHYVATSVRPQDRVAIWTATGKDQIDFTGDREQLHDALLRLTPRPQSWTGCPQIDDYEAYRVTIQEPVVLGVVHAEAVKCDCGKDWEPTMMGARSVHAVGGDVCVGMAMVRVEQDAAAVWHFADMQVQYCLEGIENAVRRLAAMPGQRSLVLVSPGFLTETRMARVDDIARRALEQDVVISAIDALGLYAEKMPHNFEAVLPAARPIKERIESAGRIAAEGVLASLSQDTGGVFYHNSNDFDEGFRQGAAVPAVYYVLTFSPPNIKLDGKFHSLKVTVNRHEALSVQARRGYFATAAALAGQPSSKEELKKVVFSPEEVHGLPAQVAARVERASDHQSKITVTTRVDVSQLRLRKEGDRNVDKLIFHTALFDSEGKLVTAKEASLDLHLRDATLERLTRSGLNCLTSFAVGPGTYRIREVVRDTERNGMSALNYPIEVPSSPVKDTPH
jgi:VWFA-related protein